MACYDFEIDVHGLVKIMDKRGIDMGCLSSLESIVHDPVRGNNEVAEAVREHPDRIIPFAVVSPRYLRGRADEELERCINTMSFKGIKLHPQLQSYRADSPVVNPIMEKARQYEVPVLFHSGPEEYSHPRLIGNLAGRFPEVTVIMGHTGGSAFLEAIWEARSHDNILLDTCGIDNSTTGVVDNSTTIGVIEHAVDLVGVERIVFGSDNPIANVGVEMAKIKLANLTQKEKDMILGENMARVLRL